MYKKIALFFLVAQITIGQWLIPLTTGDYLFPFSTWRLFDKINEVKEYPYVYLKDLKTGDLCYFFLCERINRYQINSYDPFLMAYMPDKEKRIQNYFDRLINLKEINYKVHIQYEQTTMYAKWKELYPKLKKKNEQIFKTSLY